MFNHFKNQKPPVILSDEILQKREALQEKWRDMEDSYERRDMSNLLFTDLSMLGIVDLAILADNIEVYKSQGWKEGKYWRQHLDLASLSGSRNIGEFIIDSKKEFLVKDDYEQILGYITLSFNSCWAIDFSSKMKKDNMTMPDNIYTLCDDYDLLQDIKKIFLTQSPKQRHL